MLKRLLVAVGFAVAVIAALILKTLYDAGVFKQIEPHFNGSCQLVSGVIGPEDLAISSRTGTAYVSGYDRRAQPGEPSQGGIFAYSLSDRRLVRMPGEVGIGFRPHGISLWAGPNGEESLFVINHPATRRKGPQHSVEIFDLKNGALVHRRTVRDPRLLIMPNDLVAVDRERFYLTNTHANPPGLAQQFETYLRRSQARVLYYDGESLQIALENMLMPNGINISRDGKQLFIASATGRELLIYARDPHSERLSFDRSLFLGTSPDNIDVDSEGNLWIGAHPKILALSRMRSDPTAISPSQVLFVPPTLDRFGEIYLDRGEHFSSASVGAALEDRLLIGKIFGDGFLDCTLGKSLEGAAPSAPS